MPTPTFKRITLEQFAQLLKDFPFKRRITAVHMHHTWKPEHRDFDGHRTIVGMWKYHTQQGWGDIAQHITIDPEGYIWLGRNWNAVPASARGFNGNKAAGPFMFEMIGNFDRGHDPFTGKQRDTVLGVIALVQARFDLPSNTLMFHNTMSSKSCPGSGINYAEVLAEVSRRREEIAARPRGAAVEEGPFPQEAERDVRESIRLLEERTLDTADAVDGEVEEERAREGERLYTADAPSAEPASARGSGLDPATLAAMRPHLVNLRAGRFSDGGETRTTPADVDAIFQQHLPEAIERAAAQGRSLPIVFFAHGGLVSEGTGLQVAAKHLQWWKDNGVYPIYFIWETGGLEAIGQLLERVSPFGRRDLADYTSDPLVETTVRVLNGYRVWNSMKYAAEHSVDAPTAGDPTGGGARYVAQRLAELCETHGHQVELHAVGHSAGSIFHSYFVPTANEHGAPTFRSMHFLAPAVRVDTFKQLLMAKLGPGQAAESLTLYTMKRDYERRDHCMRVYNKSLLYLIHFALEPERRAPILGLEDSLRADGELKKLFGLDGKRSPLGEVIWSVSDTNVGRSASQSVTHGGFDDDPATMESIVRRVLRKADVDTVVRFPKTRAVDPMERPWTEEIDWPDDMPPRPSIVQPASASAGWQASGPSAAWQGASASTSGTAGAGAAGSGHGATGGRPGSSSGRKLALCIGIDRYPNPRHELAGCAADARLWADTLARQGFEPTLLLDGQATRTGIEQALRQLLSRSRSGDVLVMQFAGHGTLVPDANGDESSGPDDQALCPIDFETGALFLDDDLGEVLGDVRDDVALTCFMDCCHSGSIIRFAIGPEGPLTGARDERQRFIRPSAELIEAHKRFRRARGARSLSRGRHAGPIRHVNFAACRDDESAWESNGHGEFTLHATGLLRGDISGFTNAAFADRVRALFGSRPRQQPQLFCDEGRKTAPFLQPVGAAARPAAAAASMSPGTEGADLAEIVASLTHLTAVLQNRFNHTRIH